MKRTLSACCVLLAAFATVRADPPVFTYMFPAGGQRGQTVAVRVGGLNLPERCGFHLAGDGITAPKQVERIPTVWFEGPLLPLPDSQRQEDYSRDQLASVKIAADAPLGVRYARLSTSQGATAALRFQVGDLPEVVETELAGEPIPVAVTLPVTINGRIFPREDVDVWTFQGKKGQSVVCEVFAQRLGTPLDARLEVLDPAGRRVAENDDGNGPDSFLRFTPAEDGTHSIRIHDINQGGGQAYVYRLTVTADPYVETVFPLGGRRGDTTHFELTGQAVPAKTAIALPREGAELSHRLTIDGKLSNAILLDLDDLPELLESEPNDTPEQAAKLDGPAALNGRIGTPGDVDSLWFNGKKGEAMELRLSAARLGSPLAASFTIFDAAGKELMSAGATNIDPLLRFTPPADGSYRVSISEQLRSRGGPAYAYRFRVAPLVHDFQLRPAADAISLLQGSTAKLKLTVESRSGFAEAIPLTIDGLPAGVSFTPAAIPAKSSSVDLVLKADATAKIQAVPLTIRGTAKIGDQTIERVAKLPAPRGLAELEQVLLATAIATPFKVVGDYEMRWAARGSMLQRRFRIERNGFTGPIEIRLADRQARHLQGVTGPTIIVPPEASEFTYPVFLPPWMETGRTCRVCVMASGVVKDADGNDQSVNFTSINQTEQIIAVVGPGRLGIEATPESLLAVPGQSVAIQVKVARGKGLTGPVKVELQVPAHLRNIEAAAVEVPADQQQATVTIRFNGEPGPLNMPLLLRATLLDEGRPVVAETELRVSR